MGSPLARSRAVVVATRLWQRYGSLVMLVVIAHAVVTAAVRLGFAFHIALIKPDEPIDLLYRYQEVKLWFSGITIYGHLETANYPPASYALLWPFMGWLPVGVMRLVYTISALASLAVIGWIVVRASGMRVGTHMVFAAIFLLPFGATQLTLWVGQLGLHVVVGLLGAAYLLFGPHAQGDHSGSWQQWLIDVLVAALLAMSLIKPTMSVPVVIAILILAQRWQPAVLTGVLYAGAMLVAAVFQEGSVVELVRMWMANDGSLNIPKGSVNASLWMYWLGLGDWLLIGSVALLACATLWMWHYRAINPWIVIGVAGLIGRLWMHHRAYDDLLLILPVIALFQIAITGTRKGRLISLTAGLFIAAVYVGGQIPMWAYLTGATPMLAVAAEVYRTLVWLPLFGFLLWYARIAKSEQAASERFHYA